METEQYLKDIDWINTYGRILYSDIMTVIECYGNYEPEIIIEEIKNHFEDYVLRHLFSVWKALLHTYFIYNTGTEIDNFDKVYIDKYNIFSDLFVPNIDILNLKDLNNFLNKSLYQMMDEFNIVNNLDYIYN